MNNGDVNRSISDPMTVRNGGVPDRSVMYHGVGDPGFNDDLG